MSAANGAEDFYSVEDHSARFEGLELARERDRRATEAWRLHPYVDTVDNRTDFDSKVRRRLDSSSNNDNNNNSEITATTAAAPAKIIHV